MIVLLHLLLPIFLFSQEKGEEEEQDQQICTYKAKYSSNQRIRFFPFNVAASVQLVSFRHHWNKYPIGRNNLERDSLLESKTLNKDEILELTDILYNNFYKRKTRIGTMSMCFYPRNAILFFDKNGDLKEYILICFHCDRIEKSSDNIKTGDECTNKIEKLMNFFLRIGLKFGTNKDIDSYPGESD